jgi:hypothetical protein
VCLETSQLSLRGSHARRASLAQTMGSAARRYGFLARLGPEETSFAKSIASARREIEVQMVAVSLVGFRTEHGAERSTRACMNLPQKNCPWSRYIVFKVANGSRVAAGVIPSLA